MPHTIFQRGKIWHYRGTAAGRRFRGSTKTPHKETAARIAAEREAKEWKRHLDGPEAVLTFVQAVSMYEAAGRSTRYLAKINAHWKNTLVKDITAGRIRDSARTLYPGVSGATWNRQVIVPTQAVINHAADLGHCKKVFVKRFETDTKVKKPATLEWVQAFMTAAPPHLGALALFMFLTGARISEALAVEWEDIDFTRRVARINQTKVGKEREAHLPQALVVALANLPRIEGRTVFRYVNRNSANKEWRKAAGKAGIEVLSFHCCRHGFATGLLQRGVDVITAAKLGGWSDPSHLFRTYGHASEDRTLTDRLIDVDLTQPQTAQVATIGKKTGS